MNHPTQQETQSLTDRAAIFISTACLLHCLVLPAAVIAFPVLATSLLGEERFHAILLWFLLPTSLIALTLGCRRHHDTWVIALGGAGLLLLVAAVVVVHDFGVAAERVVSITGSVALVLGHVRNQRLCREEECKH